MNLILESFLLMNASHDSDSSLPLIQTPMLKQVSKYDMNSMKQSPSFIGDSHSAGQEISCLL